jgi:uncharacterized protein YndB with AHSA1/START domain
MLAPIFFAGDLIAETATIHLETTVNAPVSEVWRAWTTEEGLISFLAPAVKVRMEVGGPFEIYFNPSLPEGTRGSEGSVILAFEEESMLSFTWNAPPGMPAIRMQRTHVTVRLRAVDANATLVTLDHDGWGRSEEWLRARAYFERAWGEVVLPNLRKRFG